MEEYYKFPLKINNLKRTHRIELLEFPISKKRILNDNQTISISDLNIENLGLYTLLPIQSKTDKNSQTDYAEDVCLEAYTRKCRL